MLVKIIVMSVTLLFTLFFLFLLGLTIMDEKMSRANRNTNIALAIATVVILIGAAYMLVLNSVDYFLNQSAK